MSDCRRTAERLTPYVDAALGEQERAAVEQHLASCPPCHDDAVCEQGGRAALRQCADRLRDEPLPPGLRTRCEALARAHRSQLTAGWRRSWPARLALVSAIAVAMVFTASALFSAITHRSDALLAAQLTADHAKCFRFSLSNVPSVDAPAVERMLAEGHGWNVHVPPSSVPDEVELVGGRRCLWADGQMPHIMYRINGQEVSLFVLEGVRREPATVVAFGHRARIWSRGSTTYVLVSHVDDGRLTAGTQYVMREAR